MSANPLAALVVRSIVQSRSSACLRAMVIVVAAAALPMIAAAQGLGRLTAVSPTNGGCVSGPSGSGIEQWNVQAGKSYQLTLSNVTDCASGGTSSTIQIMVKSSATGNVCYTATKQSTGVYVATVTMPANACATYPIRYCTSGCAPNTGFEARRHDGGASAVHLQTATFGAGCSSPTTVACCNTAITCPGPVTVECGSVPAAAVDAAGFVAQGGTISTQCSVSLTSRDDITQGSCSGNYTITRTYTVLDATNNTFTCTQTITVQDTTPPVITSPLPNMTVQCQSNIPAPNPAGVGVTDTCDPSPTVTMLSDTGFQAFSGNYFDVDAFNNALPASATINVVSPGNGGNPSYFDITISGGGILNGTIDGWCVDTTHTISNNTNYTTTVYSSYETLPSGIVDHPENMDLVNWIINQNFPGQTAACGGTFTYGDVQRAIWTLIVNTNSTSGLGTWTQCHVDAIIAAANMHDGFVPGCNQYVAVILAPAANQHVIAQVLAGGVPGVCTPICGGYETRVYRASDHCNNHTDFTQTILVNDTTAPVITATGTTTTLGCNPTPAQIDAALGTATATDNCGGTVTPVASTGSVTSNGCSRSQTRNWTASDACNNAATPVSRTVTWTVDLTAPVITATGTTLTLGCNPNQAQIDAALGTATATDNCGNVTPTAVTGNVTSNGCSRSQTRTWNVTDACGNPATAVSRTVTWTQDTTLPVITATGTSLSAGCNPSQATIDAALGTATATDNCGNVSPTATTGSITSNGCSRSQTRTWNVSDACGNAAAPVSRTVTWTVDQTAPVITATGTTLSLPCNPSTNDIDAALGTATATDNCGNVTPTAVTGNVTSNGCSRSQSRTWNVSDACGNAAAPVSRTVTWTADTTLPVITATGTTLSLGCNPSANDIGAALGTATATDNCGNVTPTAVTGNVVSTGCSRSQTRTWNVSDACGNAAAPVSRTVTWTVDQTAPIITATGTTLSLPCNPSANDIGAALGTATATDNCGNVTPTSADSAVTSNGCARSQTRTWNVSDACGNAATPVTRTVTWTEDTTPPTITAIGTTTALGCNPTASDIDAALGTATASDNCSTSLVPTQSDGQVVANGCSRSQTRTWDVTDACNNPAVSVSRTVTWTEDVNPPILSCPGTLSGCFTGGALSVPDFVGGASATDDCGQVVITQVPPAGTPLPPGNMAVTITVTATDGCGNTSSCTTFYVLASVVSAVNDLGGGCGAPAPVLHSTQPVIGNNVTVAITNAPANAPIVVLLGPAMPPFPLGSGCTLFVDPNLSASLPLFVSDATGSWSQSFFLPPLQPLLNLECILQAGVIAQGGPLGSVQLTNALRLFDGSCVPYCTYAPGSFGGLGSPGAIFDNNYLTVFPTGVTIGVFNSGNGPTAPNGLHWDGTAAGRAALKTFLTSPGGPSGALTSDATNPTTTTGTGAGQLGRQTAALALNIGFGAAGVNGGAIDYGSLVYFNIGANDSMNGSTVVQILAAANQALAGNGLPAGYTFTMMNALVASLNEAYNNCSMTPWATQHLFNASAP